MQRMMMTITSAIPPLFSSQGQMFMVVSSKANAPSYLKIESHNSSGAWTLKFLRPVFPPLADCGGMKMLRVGRMMNNDDDFPPSSTGELV